MIIRNTIWRSGLGQCSKADLPTQVLPSVCRVYLTWHLQMGPCSVSSQMCWQPPLPWLQVTMQQNTNSITSTAPVSRPVVFLSLMVGQKCHSHVQMQPRWFLANSKPGRHSQATPPLGVSLQMWAQPCSLFMQLRPSVKKRYNQRAWNASFWYYISVLIFSRNIPE